MVTAKNSGSLVVAAGEKTTGAHLRQGNHVRHRAVVVQELQLPDAIPDAELAHADGGLGRVPAQHLHPARPAGEGG